MARRVPTLGVNRLLPQASRPVPVSRSGGDAVFNAFHDGLTQIGDYLRPIAAAESAKRGAAAATEAVASGKEIGPRQPFTVSSRAFNATAERGLAVRAASDAQIKIDELVRTKGHDQAALATSLEALRTGYASEIGDWPGLQLQFNSMFERQATAANRAAGEITAQAVIDQDKAAAASALEAFERGVSQIAVSGGDPAEIAAEMTQMQELLIQFGPRGEFELNGKTYKQDDERAGSLSVADIQRAIIGTRDNVEVLAIQGEFKRSNSKGAFARRFKDSLLSGEAPVDPAKGLVLLNRMESEVRSLAAAGRSRRAAVRTELRAQMRVINTGTVAGFPPAADWEAMRSQAGNDPALLREIKDSQTRAEAIQAARNLGPDQRAEMIQGWRAQAEAAAAAGGVDLAAIAIHDQLERDQSRILAAISEESTGIDLAEDILAKTGGLTTPDELAEMRAAAEGKPELLERIDALDASITLVSEFRNMSAEERARGEETLKMEINRLTSEGAAPRALLAGLDAVEKDGAMLAGLAQDDPVQVATLAGEDVPELSFDDPAALAASMASRATAVQTVADAYNVPPRLLRPTEIPGVEAVLDGMSADAKFKLIDGLGSLDERVRETLADDLAGVSGGFGHIAAVTQEGNGQAARVMLRGQELLANKVGQRPSATTRADARLSVGLDQIVLDADSTAIIESTAEAYAVGLANGGEVTEEHMREGYQRATFRQEDGSGGLVDSDLGHVLIPAGVTESSFEDIVYATTDDDLREMNGGELPRDALGNELTAEDIANSIFKTVEPGKYLVTFPGGGGAHGAGIGGNFVYDLEAVAAARLSEENAARAAELADMSDAEAARATLRGERIRGMNLFEGN